MSRVVHKPMFIKERPLLASIVSAAVIELHGYEAGISKMFTLRGVGSIDEEQLKKVGLLSRRRVGCSSVICALGSLDASLIEPHCKSLAPSIKGEIDGSSS